MDKNNKYRRFYAHKHGSANFIEVKENMLELYNSQKYEIYKTVNQITGEKRIKENVSRLISLYCDIDEGTKREQLNKIKEVDIEPSVVIETRNGYHIYFNVTDDFSLTTYNDLMSNAIFHAYNADKQCKETNRVLRLENYNHWKGNDAPYLCKIVYESKVIYSEKKAKDVFSKYYKSEIVKPVKRSDRPYKQNITALQIAEALGNYKKINNDAYMVCCPAHDDHDPSLAITQKPDKVLLRCFGGCEQDRIISKLKDLNLWN